MRFRPRQQQLWGALDLVLSLLEAPACGGVLSALPSLLKVVIAAACTPPPALHAPGSGPGSNVQWHALACLGHLLATLSFEVRRRCAAAPAGPCP